MDILSRTEREFELAYCFGVLGYEHFTMEEAEKRLKQWDRVKDEISRYKYPEREITNDELKRALDKLSDRLASENRPIPKEIAAAIESRFWDMI